MKKLLIVSPHWPPLNMPDEHRARIMLPYLPRFGWQPYVLTVKERYVYGTKDELLLKSIPDNVITYKLNALPRKFPIHNLGFRALPYLAGQGSRIIKRIKPDLVFFSTSMFPAVYSAKFWYGRFGLPFVIDFQDPWRNDYYLQLPKRERPPKYRLYRAMNGFMERRVVPLAAGFVAVTKDYVEILKQRYDIQKPYIIEPMGVSELDFAIARQQEVSLPVELRQDCVNFVYTGVIPPNMLPVAEAVVNAVKEINRQLSRKICLYFVGTDYNALKPSRKIRLFEDFVYEYPQRVRFYSILRLMQEADALMLLGSTDPQYTPSKLYPYLLSGTKFFAVLRRESNAVRVLDDSGEIPYLTFERLEGLSQRLVQFLKDFVENGEFYVDTGKVKRYTAEQMTRRIAEFFDKLKV